MKKLSKLHYRQRFIIIFLISGFIGLILPDLIKSSPQNENWDQLPVILSRIVPPTFPANDFLITEFGAINDGKTDCSAAFAQAISAGHEAGGGRVVVPAGSYLTGPIHLKSHVNLHLRKDATILFSRDYKKIFTDSFNPI